MSNASHVIFQRLNIPPPSNGRLIEYSLVTVNQRWSFLAGYGSLQLDSYPDLASSKDEKKAEKHKKVIEFAKPNSEIKQTKL